VAVVGRLKKSDLLVSGILNERTPSIQSGLVKNHPFDGTHIGKQNRNLLDTSQWKLGTSGSQGNFSLNGSSSADINTIIMHENPWGYKEPTWAALSNDAVSDGDGGWNVYNKSIDKTKKYRLSVWVKRENVGNGTIYFGCQGNTVSNLGSTTANDNPYFAIFASGLSLTDINDNYVLMVAYIYPYDYSGVSETTSGVYNTSGKRVASVTNFKWMSTATVGGHRTYLFYSTSTTERVYWIRPRMEVCDGTESTIQDLLLGVDDNAYVGSESNTTLLSDGSGVAIEQSKENILVTSGYKADAEYSGTGYPFTYRDVSARVKELTPTGGTYSMQFEGKNDQNGVGYPVMYIYFTDWTWAYTIPISSLDWTKKKATFDMPNPTGKTVMVAVYHMNSGSTGKSYARNLQLENKNYSTSFVNGTMSYGEMSIPLNLGSEWTIAFKMKPDASWSRISSDNIGRRIFNLKDKNSQLSTWLEDYKPLTALGTSSQPWMGFDSFVSSTQANWWHWHMGVDFLEDYDCWFVLTKSGSTWTRHHFTNSGHAKGTIDTSINNSLANFSPDLIVFSGNFNAVYSNFSVYNKALTDKEVDLLVKNKFDVRPNGSVYALKLNEKPYLPSDSIYFPLKGDALTIDKNISASEYNINSIDKDGAWVGVTTVNIVTNPTTGSSGYNPGWDASLHPNAISVDGWSQGYNGGVPSPAIGYHGQWVYEGINNDPCMKFIDENEVYGVPHRWLGMSKSIGTPNSLGWGVGTTVTISWYHKSNVLNKGGQVGLYHKLNGGGYDFEGALGYYSVSKIDTWERVSYTYTITSNWDLTADVSVYAYGYNGATGTLWIDNVQVETRAFLTPFVNGTRNYNSLEFNLYRDYGLQWNSVWSIVYWKKPMGTHTNNLTGYNLESIGCNGNSVGGGYLFWGKDSGANTIFTSTPSAIDPNVYFGNYHMVSVVRNGNIVTIKERIGTNTHVRSVDVSSAIAGNAFVTQYGYDLTLGGFDNSNSPNTYYKDLIIAKRAFTDNELDAIYKNKVKQNKEKLIVQGSFKEKVVF
jgi:hypothetical protein